MTEDHTVAIFQNPDTNTYTKNIAYEVDMSNSDEAYRIANYIYFQMEDGREYSDAEFREMMKKAIIENTMMSLVDEGVVEMYADEEGAPVFRMKQR